MNLSGFKKQPPRFSTSLRELREAKGLTVQELAESCEVSTKTIEEIEDLKYEPSVVLAAHLARQLDTSVETLFQANPPTVPRSGEREERIRARVHQMGYRLFLFTMFGSLAVANVLLQLTKYEDVGLVAGLAFFVLCILFVLLSFRIKGYYAFNRSVNTQRMPSKKKQLGIAVLQGVFFAGFMQFFGNHDETLTFRIISFFALGIFYGAFQYWFTWRRANK